MWSLRSHDIAGSGQDGKDSITKVVTADAYTNNGGKGFSTCTDVQIASVATMDTIAHACRIPASEDRSVSYEALASPLENCGSRLPSTTPSVLRRTPN